MVVGTVGSTAVHQFDLGETRNNGLGRVRQEILVYDKIMNANIIYFLWLQTVLAGQAGRYTLLVIKLLGP